MSKRSLNDEELELSVKNSHSSLVTFPSDSITRVLLVGPSFSGGGAERQFSTLATHLFDGKANVAVLVKDRYPSTRITGKVFSLGWNGRLSYPKVIWLLRQRLKRERYDVVMAFGMFPCLVSILAALFMAGSTKLIVSEITRPKMEATDSKRWRTLVYNALKRVLYRRSNLITANSIDGLQETCELAGKPTEQGIRVVNVIDGACLTKKSLVELDILLPEGKYIMCVGRLVFMKRIDTVVDALGVLSDRIECKLVIVGDGEARQDLESQVNALGLRDSVIFTGMLDNPFPLLKHAAALVLASEYEGYSNSVLEAMFLDVPVITSFCSSDAHEMCDQGAALGFEVGDINQLAEQIATVVTDESSGRSLVAHACVYRSPHAIERAIPLYEGLIRRVAGQSVAECGGAHQ